MATTRPLADLSYEQLAALTEPRLVTDLPGPRASAVIERDGRITSPSLPRAYPLAPARGAGAVVEDVDGNAFLDFNAAIAVCSTGHAHPKVVAAIKEQAEKLLHYSASDFYLPIYSEVCARLESITPVGGEAKSFLTNSGTEAVEAAIKLARRHTRRQYVISFFGAFHGRTYGSVTLTASKSNYRAYFGPTLPGVIHAPFGYCHRCPINLTYPECDLATVDYIEDVIFRRLVKPDEVAAVVVEPIQGEGGYIVPPPGWLQKLRHLCSEHGILFVADEVQSGMGRTGRMWALEHAGVVPDIVLAGKGIASGMPLGAMIARADLMSWDVGAHGSTYGGNPVSCAAALVTIDLIQSELAGNAAAVGGFMLEGLRALKERQPLIDDVRGVGMMIGVEFQEAEIADAVEIRCFRRGVLTLRAGDSTVRMSPPLVMNKEQAVTGLRVFEEACADAAAGLD